MFGKSPHPIWGGLYCKSYTIKKAGAGAIITAQFEGSEFQWDSEKDSEENTIELAATMREEPIETHPKFKDWIAEEEDGQSVAIFDDDGNFKTWNKDTKLGAKYHFFCFVCLRFKTLIYHIPINDVPNIL